MVHRITLTMASSKTFPHSGIHIFLSGCSYCSNQQMPYYFTVIQSSKSHRTQFSKLQQNHCKIITQSLTLPQKSFGMGTQFGFTCIYVSQEAKILLFA